METILILVFMIIVGAAIGGITNSIAIKMLFRPYHAKYIGRFKIPFTPGLIPKRQKELAKQMGDMVIQHLLTPEGIKRKINNDRFFQQALLWIDAEIKSLLKKDISIEECIQKFHIPITVTTLEASTKQVIQSKLEAWLNENGHQKIKEILPQELIGKTKEYIPYVSSYILQHLDSYLQSEEGKEKIGLVADNYLGSRGFFGSMISSFLGGDGLADKIQPAISQFLHSDDAKIMIHRLLEQQLQNVLEKEIEEFHEFIYRHNIPEQLSDMVVSFISIEELLQIKLSDLYTRMESTITTRILPELMKWVQQYVVEKIGPLMERMKLQEIVKEEVEQFDVGRLEQMVLSITKRELKMITYLGALLGGVIGFVQGLIVQLLT